MCARHVRDETSRSLFTRLASLVADAVPGERSTDNVYVSILHRGAHIGTEALHADTHSRVRVLFTEHLYLYYRIFDL